MGIKNVGSASLYDIWYLIKAISRIILSRSIGMERELKRIRRLIMANQEDLLAAVEAAKLELMAAADAEKVEVLDAFGVLNTRITELEAIIASGGDTQPAIDALKAASAEVVAKISGIKE